MKKCQQSDAEGSEEKREGGTRYIHRAGRREAGRAEREKAEIQDQDESDCLLSAHDRTIRSTACKVYAA
jgi:hypothetical protein